MEEEERGEENEEKEEEGEGDEEGGEEENKQQAIEKGHLLSILLDFVRQKEDVRE
jgi:hypothetical protein